MTHAEAADKLREYWASVPPPPEDVVEAARVLLRQATGAQKTSVDVQLSPYIQSMLRVSVDDDGIIVLRKETPSA